MVWWGTRFEELFHSITKLSYFPPKSYHWRPRQFLGLRTSNNLIIDSGSNIRSRWYENIWFWNVPVKKSNWIEVHERDRAKQCNSILQMNYKAYASNVNPPTTSRIGSSNQLPELQRWKRKIPWTAPISFSTLACISRRAPASSSISLSLLFMSSKS